MFPKTGTPIAFNLNSNFFAVDVPQIFFIFLVRHKLKKFENHWCKQTKFTIVNSPPNQDYKWHQIEITNDSLLQAYIRLDQMTFSCEKQKTPSLPPRMVVSKITPESAACIGI